MRKKYIDNIRWITVALVVIYHVFYIFNGSGVLGGVGSFSDTHYQDIVLYILYPWFMLLLFVVSGMSARFYLETHTHREFIKSKTTKLLIPSTLALFVFWWILGYFNLKIGGAFENMQAVPKPILYIIMSVSGTGPLWYIQLLWMFSMGLVLLRKIEKDRLWNFCGKTNCLILIMLALLVWGAAQIGNTPVVTAYRFGIYGTGYLLGYFVFSHDEVMNRLEKIYLPICASSIIFGIAFTAVFWGKPYAEHIVLDTPLCNLYAWTAVLAILSFMKKRGNFENGFTRFMIKKSWGLYLFHYLPLAACAYYIYNADIPVALKYITTAFSSFFGGVFLYGIISRIPVLRYVVCGITGGAECSDINSAL